MTSQLIATILLGVWALADSLAVYWLLKRLRRLSDEASNDKLAFQIRNDEFEHVVIEALNASTKRHDASAKRHETSAARHEALMKQHDASSAQHEASMKRHEASSVQHKLSTFRHDAAVGQQEKQQAALEFAIQTVGNVVQKKLAVMQDSDICSQCHLHVVRYSTHNGKVICANCDYDRYKAGI